MKLILTFVSQMVLVNCHFVDQNSFMFGSNNGVVHIDLIVGVSFMDCVKECLHRQRCLSVSYRSTFHLCELSKYDKSSILQLPPNRAGYLTTSMQDWQEEDVRDCSSIKCAIDEKCILMDGKETCLLSGTCKNVTLRIRGCERQNQNCGDGITLNSRQPKLESIGFFSKSFYDCPVGYTLKGKSYGVCQADGRWKEPLFVCEIVDCGKPDGPHGQNISMLSTVYGSIGNVTCEEKYNTVDPAIDLVTIECSARGSWTQSTLQCTWGGCPPLETIQAPECVNLSLSTGEYIGDYARFKGTNTNGHFLGPFAYCDCNTNQTWSDIGNIVCTQDSDCEEVNLSFAVSGIYSLQRPQKTTLVYCDMDFISGGWTVIQRRLTGQVDFKRNWNEYKYGFGDVNTEYWIGNDIIHDMTYPNGKRAIFLMEDKDGNERYAEYSTFLVKSEEDGYQLTVSGYRYHSNTAGDALSYNANGHRFTTIDRDQDAAAWGNCALHYNGGWWYGGCHTANPNGKYGADNAGGIVWSSWKGMQYSMSKMVIMIKD